MKLIEVRSAGPYSLAIHGGASNRHPSSGAGASAVRDGLSAALASADAVLRANGDALDAVCVAVVVLENCEVFNAGRGAALTVAGTTELDAAVMVDDHRAGAVAGARFATNPVLAARAVMERTPHALLVDPQPDVLAELGVESCTAGYHVTERRSTELAEGQAGSSRGSRHGTVGAVARDRRGRLAAATSTGGMTNQMVGRVGDTPILGGGTYADVLGAVSCTGEGEYFMRYTAARNVVARIEYAHQLLPDAVRETFSADLEPRATGGMIAVDGQGSIVLAYNSRHMFGAYLDEMHKNRFL